jgi:hypothetical protein
MPRHTLIAALIMAMVAAMPGVAFLRGQQPPASTNPTEAKPAPAKAGTYSLVVTTLEPSPSVHWLNPPPTVDVKAGSKLSPADTTGNLTVPAQNLIEAFGVPQRECAETAPLQVPQQAPQQAPPQPHGCDALDRVDFAIRDPNTVEYRVVSHGAAVQLRVNLQVHDLLPASHNGAGTDWHTGDVIFVSVPKATPEFRFVSETLVGVWNGEPVVFEAGKPLPATAKKCLDDLGVHQDLGDSVLYSYKVK